MTEAFSDPCFLIIDRKYQGEGSVFDSVLNSGVKLESE